MAAVITKPLPNPAVERTGTRAHAVIATLSAGCSAAKR